MKRILANPMILLFRLEWLSQVAFACCLFAGCATKLDPTGVYKGDTVLYEADNTIVTGHDLLQDFVNWEANYRSTLAQWPEIRQFADKVVAEGPGWFASASALRDAYKANPSDASKTALQAATDIIHTALAQATQYLTAHKTTATTPPVLVPQLAPQPPPTKK